MCRLKQIEGLKIGPIDLRPSINARTVLAVTLPLFLVACTENLADKDLWFWLKALFGLWVVYKVVAWMARHSGGGGNGSGGDSCGGFDDCGGD